MEIRKKILKKIPEDGSDAQGCNERPVSKGADVDKRGVGTRMGSEAAMRGGEEEEDRGGLVGRKGRGWRRGVKRILPPPPVR